MKITQMDYLRKFHRIKHFTPLKTVLGILICTQVLLACQSQDTGVYVTPTNFEETDMPQIKTRFPEILECALVDEISVGPSWRNLSIGNSTLENIENELRPEFSTYDERTDKWIYSGGTVENQDFYIIEGCFVDNKLSALNIMNSEIFRKTLEELELEYGIPSHVTWGPWYVSRTVIWSHKGVLAVVRIDTETTVNIILFAPISQDDYEESWLAKALPSLRQEYTEDLHLRNRFPAEKEVEDPWGFTEN